MSKLNIALVSGLLVLAAVLGAVALTRTMSVGSADRQSVDAAVRAHIVYHRPPPIVVVRHVHHGDAGESEGGSGDD